MQHTRFSFRCHVRCHVHDYVQKINVLEKHRFPLREWNYDFLCLIQSKYNFFLMGFGDRTPWTHFYRICHFEMIIWPSVNKKRFEMVQSFGTCSPSIRQVRYCPMPDRTQSPKNLLCI